jgi:hypothetical protein
LNLAATEEIGKVVSNALNVVKEQPMVMALILFNLLFATLVFLGSKDFRANQLKLMTLMIEMSGRSQDLLAQCIIPVPERRGGLSLPLILTSDQQPVPLPPPRPRPPEPTPEP